MDTFRTYLSAGGSTKLTADKLKVRTLIQFNIVSGRIEELSGLLNCDAASTD